MHEVSDTSASYFQALNKCKVTDHEGGRHTSCGNILVEYKITWRSCKQINIRFVGNNECIFAVRHEKFDAEIMHMPVPHRQKRALKSTGINVETA